MPPSRISHDSHPKETTNPPKQLLNISSKVLLGARGHDNCNSRRHPGLTFCDTLERLSRPRRNFRETSTTMRNSYVASGCTKASRSKPTNCGLDSWGGLSAIEGVAIVWVKTCGTGRLTSNELAVTGQSVVGLYQRWAIVFGWWEFESAWLPGFFAVIRLVGVSFRWRHVCAPPIWGPLGPSGVFWSSQNK